MLVYVTQVELLWQQAVRIVWAIRTKLGRAPDPGMVWVRHQGTVQQVPLCPEMRPYSTVFWMRVCVGKTHLSRENRVISVVDGSRFTVTGSGRSSRDPMFCQEMESQPLPQCHCEELADLEDGDDSPSE